MTLSELQRVLVRDAYAAYFRTPTAKQRQAAKEVMKDCEAPATAVLIAARHLLGPTFLSYEPETLWLELEDPCPANRDKLMAAIALAMTPSFYWDYRVFGATTHALNNELVSPETVPHCTPAQMAWAVFEAELLYALTDGESSSPEFDDCVTAYIATFLSEEGLVIPPSGLSFCSDVLKQRLSGEALKLHDETLKAWDALPKDKLDVSAFKDNALGAQLHKLTDVWIYVTSRAKSLRAGLATL